MAKVLYSLMLSDEVMKEVDSLAHRRGRSRSAQVNDILAEYLSVSTPESRAEDIFRCACELAGAYRDLVALYSPNQSSMAIKSMLSYKYRPTLKYEICLAARGSGGSITAIYRTRSEQLDSAVRSFASKWASAELGILTSRGSPCPEYRIAPGKIERSLASLLIDGSDPERSARAIVEYIGCFDKALKLYLDGAPESQIAELCAGYFSNYSEA